jgi:hypothetical protein
MLRRLLAVGIVLAVAAPATADAAVTIKTSGDKRDYQYPEKVRIKGKTGDYRGIVTLQTDEYPYDSFGQAAIVETDGKGEYVFPDVVFRKNSRVKVVAGSQTSKTIELYFHPGVKFKRRRADYDHDRVALTLTGHPGFTVPPDRLFIYMLKQGADAFQRLGRGRTMSQVRDGVWRYVGLARLPSSKHGYSYNMGFCVKDVPGYGRPHPYDEGCGERRVNVR